MDSTYNITDEAGRAPLGSASALAALTVNDALIRWPQSIGALNAFGIDCCCGGGVTLAVAARDAGISTHTLLEAIVPRDAALPLSEARA